MKQRLFKLFRFGLIGSISAIANFLITYLLKKFGFGVFLAALLGQLFAFIYGLVMYSSYVFQSKSNWRGKVIYLVWNLSLLTLYPLIVLQLSKLLVIQWAILLSIAGLSVLTYLILQLFVFVSP